MTEVVSRPQVYLVGAGPGDPDLLTVKAERVIRAADVVVYDRLVGAGIVALAPPAAERVFVGKSSGFHPIPQAQINALLVAFARAGRAVVRLKGGDPFVFGRGGEEAEELRRQGIPYVVIPGITAASGCLAEYGIPLTHRDMATGVRLVTGHRHGDAPLDLNWRSLADPGTTLVFYMALASLPEIRDRLIEAGLPAETPAAAISNGTTAQRRLCRGTLATLPDRVAAARLAPPTLLVIGGVATFARMPAGPAPAEEARRAPIPLVEVGHV